MQMGVRWNAGSEPHRSVPPSLHGVIAEQEAAHPNASSWTLTWLEGRPRCDLDGLVTVTLDGAGNAAVENDVAAAHAAPAGLPDEEDDDWLS